MNDGTFKEGIRAKIRPTLKTPSPNNPKGILVPWYKDYRSLKPDGFLEGNTVVTIISSGSYFAVCISPVGVVFFRTENLIPLE